MNSKTKLPTTFPIAPASSGALTGPCEGCRKGTLRRDWGGPWSGYILCSTCRARREAEEEGFSETLAGAEEYQKALETWYGETATLSKLGRQAAENFENRNPFYLERHEALLLRWRDSMVRLLRGTQLKQKEVDTEPLLRFLNTREWEDSEKALLKMQEAVALMRKSVVKSGDPATVPAVSLDDETREVKVFGRDKGEVTRREAKFLRVLIDIFPERIKGEKLQAKAIASDAGRVLRELADRDRDWAAAILLAGVSYQGHGLAALSADPQTPTQNTKQKTKNTN